MFGLLFPILLVAMGAYVLIGAIRGSGKLLSTENFKDDYVVKGRKYLRIVYFCLAGVMFVMAISNLLQYSLYTNRIIHYSISQKYKDDFADVLEAHTDENGMFSYKVKENQTSGMSCMGGAATTVEKLYENIDPESKMLTAEQTYALLSAARDTYPDMFPQQAAQMSCFGGSAAEDPTAKYYEAKAYEVDGKQVYSSSFSGIRSDAAESSFVKTLYNTFSPTLLEIVNYVCIGLAIAGIVLLFVLTAKFTDKEKAAKARSTYSAAGSSMPSSAFNFDDNKKEN